MGKLCLGLKFKFGTVNESTWYYLTELSMFVVIFITSILFLLVKFSFPFNAALRVGWFIIAPFSLHAFH